jgi:hypothetical protein
LPAAFAKAVDRALSVDPADRFQSAETMRAALESALGKSHRRLSVRALRAGAVTIGIAALASAVALTWMRNADPVRVAATSTQKVRERKLRVPQYPMGVPSRDGRFFPYVSSAGHLYVWEVATGQSRRLNAADAASGSARSASMSAAADRVAVGWRLSDGAHELRVFERRWNFSACPRRAPAGVRTGAARLVPRRSVDPLLVPAKEWNIRPRTRLAGDRRYPASSFLQR